MNWINLEIINTLKRGWHQPFAWHLLFQTFGRVNGFFQNGLESAASHRRSAQERIESIRLQRKLGAQKFFPLQCRSLLGGQRFRTRLLGRVLRR